MRLGLKQGRERGLTWIELLVVLATLLLVVFCLLPILAGRRYHANLGHTACTSNLKQIGLAMRMFSHDHEGKFPWVVPKEKGGSMEYTSSVEVFQYFLAVSNELGTPKLLACPMDRQRMRATNWQGLSNSNLSYFVGLNAVEGRPQSILAGDRSLGLGETNAIGVVQVQKNSNPQVVNSFHDGHIHLAFGDGSVQQLTEKQARNWILYTNDLPMRVAVP